MSPSRTSTKPKKDENPWSSPAVIVAIIGLVGTLVTLYFNYLQSTRPLELSATQTAETRLLTSFVSTPTPSLLPLTPTTRSTPIPATLTASPSPTSTPTYTPVSPTVPPPTPNGLQYCVAARTSIYVRSGPGTTYGAIGVLTLQDCLYLDGQISVDDVVWLHIAAGQTDYPELNGGWVRSDLVRPQDFDQLPALVLTPTPTPSITPEG